MKLLTRSEMRLVNPINLMVLVDGDRRIAPEVSLVVCVGVLLCSAIINFKPWSKRFATLAPSKVEIFRHGESCCGEEKLCSH